MKVTVTKGDEVLDEVTKSIRVKNEAPQITSLLLDRAEIDEDQQVVLTGTFTDNGLQDRHWVVIDWGDGFRQACCRQRICQVTWEALSRHSRSAIDIRMTGLWQPNPATSRPRMTCRSA